jgi:hypothetical protein
MTLFGLASLALFAARNPNSPWAPAEWRLDLNIGREDGTWMPEEWAESGARLSFSVDALIESEYCSMRDDEMDFMGPNALRLNVLEDPSFISSEGEEFIAMPEEGAWKLRLPKRKGAAGTLRFWMDTEAAPELGDMVAARRNDVILPAERLYCMAKCWREPDLIIGSRKIKPFEVAAREAQQRLDDQLSHQSGDRRLDGTNPVDTAMASLSMAKLVKDRDDRVRELKEAERTLPRNAEKLPLGRWPGTTEKLAIARGTIAVKRGKLLGDEFHVIGKWSAVPVLQQAGVLEERQQ